MTISNQSWNRYVERLSKLDHRAGEEMEAYIRQMGTEDTDGLIAYANALVTKYGEGSAELAAQMYDEMAGLAGVDCYPAEPAEVSTIEEITQAIHAAKKSAPLIKQAVSRMVKLAGADTTLKNALRDGAQFAWIPGGGETCAFCITLASRGWQNISKKAMRRGHAEHIHANCDCNYTVRFDRETSVAGYEPDKYLEMYESAEGGTPEEKVASLRQSLNSQNREKINAQKRAAYAAKKQRETGEAVREYKKITLGTSTKAAERGKIDLKHPTNPVTGEQYTEHKLVITDEQFGSKFGRHAQDYGLERTDPESRRIFNGIITEIVSGADERFYGDWRSQEYPVLFHVKGEDVVIESKNGEFISILKGGVTNARVKNARER